MDVSRKFQASQARYRRLSVVNVSRFEGEAFKNFETLQIDTSNISLDQAVADLERDPSVEYAQPNYIVYAHEEPNGEEGLSEGARGRSTGHGKLFPLDISSATRGAGPAIALIPSQPSNIADPDLSKTWGISKIGADVAWRKQRGGKSVIVAVIDSGVDYNHPDLAGNIWRNPKAAPPVSTGVDANGSRIVGDVIGWDFVQNDGLPFDQTGHGTHVAGTIGAVGRNGMGVSGISQQVSILAVRFLDASGRGDTAAAIKAIDYAVSRGAKILNNSWGGKGGYNRALKDAIARAEAAGVLFVASAGNEGTDNDRAPSYPAAFADLPNVISVAATTATDNMASFSNYGRATVHVGAPGVSVYSLKPGGGFQYMSGTSMASPHVAGAAALLWAQFPNATYAEIKRRLIDSGDRLPSLAGRTISGRRINVQRALERRESNHYLK